MKSPVAANARARQPMAAYIAQFVEDRRILPDVREGLFAQVARDHGQITAGIHFAFMRDEAHAGSGQAALRHGIEVGRMPSGVTDGLTDATWL